jgi:hypothetical protein
VTVTTRREFSRAQFLPFARNAFKRPLLETGVTGVLTQQNARRMPSFRFADPKR